MQSFGLAQPPLGHRPSPLIPQAGVHRQTLPLQAPVRHANVVPGAWLPPQSAAPQQPLITAHAKHRRKHRRRQKKDVADFLGCFGSPPAKPKTKLHMVERSGMAVSIDSADEEDWDGPTVNNKVWGNRLGPQRERPVDDLLITVQDLFPCLAPLWESCGCGPRRQKRMLQTKVTTRGPAETVPKLETVCLDCGNVLDAKHLPRSVALDMFDRGNPAHHLAFTQGLEGGEEDAPVGPGAFEGYESWRVMQRPSQRTRVNFVPLPQFEAAPARLLQNRPIDVVDTTAFAPGGYGLDDTGHVQLPEFPEAAS